MWVVGDTQAKHPRTHNVENVGVELYKATDKKSVRLPWPLCQKQDFVLARFHKRKYKWPLILSFVGFPPLAFIIRIVYMINVPRQNEVGGGVLFCYL